MTASWMNNSSPYPPEEQAVLAALDVTESSADTLTAAASTITNWQRFITLADDHRLLPLLHTRSAVFPQHVKETIEASYLASLARNTFLLKRLAALHTFLTSNGIPCLAQRGPLLSVLLHSDPALRPCDDLDLLVHQRDLLRLRHLLPAFGLVPLDTFTPSQAAAYSRINGGAVFRDTASGTLVEFSPRVTPYFYPLDLPDAATWSTPQNIETPTHPLPTLGMIDLLIALSAHGTKHTWERLLWIYDIAALLHRHATALPGEELLERAAQKGARRVLLLACSLAHELFHATLPCTLANAMTQDRHIRTLTQATIDRITGKDATDMSLRALLRFQQLARERRKDRWRLALTLLLTPTSRDIQHIRLGPLTGPAAWLIRPFRLSASVVRRALRGAHAPASPAQSVGD